MSRVPDVAELPDLRTKRELLALTARSGPLATDSPHNTQLRYAGQPERGRLRKQIKTGYLTPDDSGYGRIVSERAAIVTAGPPGAGKSTILGKLGRAGYREVDSDEIKDLLLKDIAADDLYGRLMADNVLADGRPLAPRELAALVHRESTSITDDLQEICLRRGENLIVQGTLGWPGLPDALLAKLIDFEYVDLEVVDVQVDRAECHRRGTERWWDGRIGDDPMGGRFTPTDSIDALYVDDTHSVCTDHAGELAEKAAASGRFASVTLTTVDPRGEVRVERRDSAGLRR